VVDTHCHLDACEEPVPELVRNAREAGVERMLAIGMDTGSCRHAISAADDFDEVFVSVGRHPHESEGYDQAVTDELELLIEHPKVRAVGEAGLDYKRDYAPRDDQRRSFIAQMELAREARIPLVVHTREAAGDTLELLAEHANGVEVIIHCFSLSDHLDECIERGYYCSFAGNVTYPKATDLHEAAARVPDELILVETDAPFLSPQERRSKPNQPAFVTSAAGFLAELRGTPLHAMESILDGNAARLFRW
jgi:TatD DNase family protein